MSSKSTPQLAEERRSALPAVIESMNGMAMKDVATLLCAPGGCCAGKHPKQALHWLEWVIVHHGAELGIEKRRLECKYGRMAVLYVTGTAPEDVPAPRRKIKVCPVCSNLARARPAVGLCPGCGLPTYQEQIPRPPERNWERCAEP